MNDYGFIIIRHINSSLTNEYWKECYTCIRKFYPNNKIWRIIEYKNGIQNGTQKKYSLEGKI